MNYDKMEFDEVLNKKILEIFKDIDYNKLSNFRKRKMIYDYLVNNLEYDYVLLSEIYDYKPRNYKAEIMSGLNEGKKNKDNKGLAVCNGISYAYKLLLERVGIESILIASNIEVDDVNSLKNIDINHVKKGENGKFKLGHMFILVKNEDGTFSFDDPTCDIMHKDEKMNWFNYELEQCAEKSQVDIQGFGSDLLYYFVGREKPKTDILLEKEFQGIEEGFLGLPKNIKSYKEQNKLQEQDNMER